MIGKIFGVKILDADPYNSVIRVKLAKTNEIKEFLVRNREISKMAAALRKKVVDLVVEDGVIIDITTQLDVTIYGAKYSEIKDFLP